ncbi:MAG: hypothetical protein VX874_22525 [Pseudomonadota bacterium]|nr:hypothetical protein [Pseudomonadota bacterium]
MPDRYLHRVTLDDDRQVAEIDLTGLRLETSGEVNALYDAIEAALAQSGEELWFFLINYSGFRIDSDAWYTHHKRGKALNLGHSMGTVRVDMSDETRRQIERTAETEAFDPNLFADREAALARLATLPSRRRTKVAHKVGYSEADFAKRISFDGAREIMNVDFSNFVFHHSGDVNAFYDHIEARLEETAVRWFFLINYDGCRIFEEAWVAYARRGKLLNERWSMGSVRYAPGSETEETIRMRAESQQFRPNIRNTRDEALARIAEMKAEMAEQ